MKITEKYGDLFQNIKTNAEFWKRVYRRKYRKKQRNKRFFACFLGLKEGKLDAFCPLDKVSMNGAEGYEILYLIDFLLFR